MCVSAFLCGLMFSFVSDVYIPRSASLKKNFFFYSGLPGGNIILACRDMEKCEAAAKDIRGETLNHRVNARHLDLASLKSIREFATKIIEGRREGAGCVGQKLGRPGSEESGIKPGLVQPCLVWLSGLSAGLQTKGSPVQFPFGAHAWVAGQVPSRGCVRGNHTVMFFSLSFSLPSLF